MKVYGEDDLKSIEKEDRRVRRTRMLLSDALLALMQEERYDKITVQDIVDRADVGRSTFYAHYRDKEDLLVRDFERLLDLLGRHVQTGGEKGQELLPGQGLFQYVQDHHCLYKALVWGRGTELLFKEGQAYLSGLVEEHLAALLPGERAPSVPLPLMSSYLAGALLWLLKWWLDNGMPHSPERMAEIYEQLAMPGAWAVLGVEV